MGLKDMTLVGLAEKLEENNNLLKQQIELLKEIKKSIDNWSVVQ